jgi:hypothetical protein
MFTRGLVAAVSLSASSLALAFDGVAIRSSTGISNVSYTLQDLNVQDGLSPLFIPSTNPQATLTTLTAGAYTYPDYPPSVSFASLPFDSSSQILTGPDFTAASKSGNNLASKTNLMLPTLANLVQTGGASTPIPATASAVSTTLWTLSAYSQVTVQGTITSSIDFDIAQLLNAGTRPLNTFAAETNFATFFYTKDAAGNVAYLDGTTSGSLYAYWNSQNGTMTGGYANDGSIDQSSAPSIGLTRSFTLTATNNTAFSQDIYLVLTTGSQVRWIPTPDNPAIPEPSTYVLMGLGLSLMAWRVRTARRS